jgi:hypothetical protein
LVTSVAAVFFNLPTTVTTHKTNNSFIVAPVTVFTFYSLFFSSFMAMENLWNQFFFEFFNFQFRFLAIIHQPNKTKKKAPTYLATYLPTSWRGSIGP